MADYDCFNGDADGLCALHQLRMAEPRKAQLVTGVKRDLRLLDKLTPRAGDRITVLDVCLNDNREALARALDAGADIRWIDHRSCGAIPAHPALSAHIGKDPNVCTSLIVDRLLGGRYRPWAIVAAFGDNLDGAGIRLAAAQGWSVELIARASRLGQALNYNAYGETVADLVVAPAELFARLHGYADPFEFFTAEPVVRQLIYGMEDDLANVERLRPTLAQARGAVFVMPNAPWSRRVGGIFANRLARQFPQRAHAVAVPLSAGDGYRVSVRAPRNRPRGADALCRRFPSGGGRETAAGINRLAPAHLWEFIDAFAEAFELLGEHSRA